MESPSSAPHGSRKKHRSPSGASKEDMARQIATAFEQLRAHSESVQEAKEAAVEATRQAHLQAWTHSVCGEFGPNMHHVCGPACTLVKPLAKTEPGIPIYGCLGSGRFHHCGTACTRSVFRRETTSYVCELTGMSRPALDLHDETRETADMLLENRAHHVPVDKARSAAIIAVERAAVMDPNLRSMIMSGEVPPPPAGGVSALFASAPLGSPFKAIGGGGGGGGSFPSVLAGLETSPRGMRTSSSTSMSSSVPSTDTGASGTIVDAKIYGLIPPVSTPRGLASAAAAGSTGVSSGGLVPPRAASASPRLPAAAAAAGDGMMRKPSFGSGSAEAARCRASLAASRQQIASSRGFARRKNEPRLAVRRRSRGPRAGDCFAPNGSDFHAASKGAVATYNGTIPSSRRAELLKIPRLKNLATTHVEAILFNAVRKTLDAVKQRTILRDARRVLGSLYRCAVAGSSSSSGGGDSGSRAISPVASFSTFSNALVATRHQRKLIPGEAERQTLLPALVGDIIKVWLLLHHTPYFLNMRGSSEAEFQKHCVAMLFMMVTGRRLSNGTVVIPKHPRLFLYLPPNTALPSLGYAVQDLTNGTNTIQRSFASLMRSLRGSKKSIEDILRGGPKHVTPRMRLANKSMPKKKPRPKGSAAIGSKPHEEKDSLSWRDTVADVAATAGASPKNGVSPLLRDVLRNSSRKPVSTSPARTRKL